MTDIQRWTVGNATVTSVVETEMAGLPSELLLPAATAVDITAQDWLMPDYATADGSLLLRIQAFVIDIDDRRVLVDPCVGNDKVRSLPFWHMRSYPFLDDFAAAGFDPTGIDLVVHTHLHADHVGWDTHLVDGAWASTFPNARHLYTQRELDYRRTQDEPGTEEVFADSIEPIFAAGLADIVAEDEDLGDGLRLAPTPGHTPGHTSLWIHSGGERAVVTGDLIHHPVQCAHPEWAEIADADIEQARQTRHAFLRDVALGRSLVFGTHFPSSPAGHVVPYEDAWRFAPVAALSVG